MKKNIKAHPTRVIHQFDQKMFTVEEKLQGFLLSWEKNTRMETPLVTGLLAGLTYLEEFKLPSHLHQEVPVYLLMGAKDPITRVEGAVHLQSILPRGHLTTWEETGHLPMWTNPDMFHYWLKECILYAYDQRKV
jgi:pimeloyl-ACP methyl ester carboxylesterase